MRRMKHRQSDRGAVTLIVAIVVPVLLLVLGGVVVSVGSWYSMRAQTQNGADAAAQAVAISCGKGSCNTSVATTYATANLANSIVNTAMFPCGHDSNSSGQHLTACDPVVENGTVCPSTHPTNYVNVQVVTQDAVGISGLAGGTTKVAACAQATWGAPSSLGNAVALTISACEWLEDTNNGTSFATIPASMSYTQSAPNYTSPPTYLDTITARRQNPVYNVAGGNFYVVSGSGGEGIYDPRNPQSTYAPNPPAPSNATVAGSETVITTHGFGNACDAGHPGWAAPGQFGWLSNSTCQVAITGSTYVGVGGNSTAPCEAAFTDSRNNLTPIYLPVYSSVSGSTYTLDGFAAFVVTGWDMSNGNAGNWSVKKAASSVALADSGLPNQSSNANYCGVTYTGSNSDVCVYGYFTQALIPASALPGGAGGGTDLGATAPYLTG
jgi:Flp pilus assembly protein TadG